MVKCNNCAKSYDEEFSFCPYCGHLKLQRTPSKSSVALPMFEEAHLQLNSSQLISLETYPFDWQPGFLDKLLGGTGRNYKEINLCRLELHVTNPFKGSYMSYQSEPFMAYYFGTSNGKSDISFPMPVANMLIHQPKGNEWLDKFFLERKNAWNALYNYLITEQWRAMTESAIRQVPPFTLSYNWNRKETSLYDDGGLILNKWTSISAIQSISHAYRYQRQIS